MPSNNQKRVRRSRRRNKETSPLSAVLGAEEIELRDEATRHLEEYEKDLFEADFKELRRLKWRMALLRDELIEDSFYNPEGWVSKCDVCLGFTGECCCQSHVMMVPFTEWITVINTDCDGCEPERCVPKTTMVPLEVMY